jgi:threonine dehydratase
MDITAIEQSRERIKPFIKRTALESSYILSQQLRTNVSVKLELFQKTGSFKVRGAFNKLLSLTDEERKRAMET